MTTPEQQARDMLQRAIHCDLVELANLIAENAALKAELQALRGSAEPSWWLRKFPGDDMGHVIAKHAWDAFLALRDEFQIPLYTRPAVPLTDERIAEAMDVWRVSPTSEADFIKGIRAAEAAHNIKGAKP